MSYFSTMAPKELSPTAVPDPAEGEGFLPEMLFLLSVPGLRESLKEGLAEPVENCSEQLDW